MSSCLWHRKEAVILANMTYKSEQQCLFQASFWRDPPKKCHQTAAKLCALNLFFIIFFGHGNKLQIYCGNILLVDNKRRKLFSLSNQKGANLCQKCTKIHLVMGSARTHWGSLCNKVPRCSLVELVMLFFSEIRIGLQSIPIQVKYLGHVQRSKFIVTI